MRLENRDAQTCWSTKRSGLPEIISLRRGQAEAHVFPTACQASSVNASDHGSRIVSSWRIWPSMSSNRSASAPWSSCIGFSVVVIAGGPPPCPLNQRENGRLQHGYCFPSIRLRAPRAGRLLGSRTNRSTLARHQASLNGGWGAKNHGLIVAVRRLKK